MEVCHHWPASVPMGRNIRQKSFPETQSGLPGGLCGQSKNIAMLLSDIEAGWWHILGRPPITFPKLPPKLIPFSHAVINGNLYVSCSKNEADFLCIVLSQPNCAACTSDGLIFLSPTVKSGGGLWIGLVLFFCPFVHPSVFVHSFHWFLCASIFTGTLQDDASRRGVVAFSKNCTNWPEGGTVIFAHSSVCHVTLPFVLVFWAKLWRIIRIDIAALQFQNDTR